MSANRKNSRFVFERERSQDDKLHDWLFETDENDELIRPWALNGHPLNEFALKNAEFLINNPILKDVGTDEILRMVDITIAGMISK